MTNLYIARSERLAARKLLDETVILRPDDSGLYVLNELGTVIWDAADGATTLATIVERAICPQFDVDAATALQDATEFVERLRDHHILEVSATPMTSATAAAPSNERAS
jgi:coenzyme PQQ synthesis protein D (PqqD)